MESLVKIGSRGSKLAFIQASLVQNKLESVGVKSEIVIIKTSGDIIVDKPLYDIGGKALFVKELEESLLENKIDIAVHSMKDIPAQIPHELVVPACLERENICDVLISKNSCDINSLPIGAKIGTCAVRRIAILKALRPDLTIFPLRGNIDTRLRKFDTEHFDAIILAAAGLNRLGIWRDYFHIINPEIMIPAVGQGAIGIEARRNDANILNILSKINHEETFRNLQLERGFVEKIDGSCHTPLGCYSKVVGDKIHAYFMLAKDDLSAIYRTQNIYDKSESLYECGSLAAKELLRKAEE